MERAWVFERLAVWMARVDFVDPAVAGADARERGVRVEIRPSGSVRRGSIYASDPLTLEPAICRIDFLESSPGAADRMHWHPEMHDGEPGERTFDPTMPPDPVAWLTTFLTDRLEDHLARRGIRVGAAMAGDLEAIRAVSREIGRAVTDGLAWARAPWPDAEHDERGMAPV